MRNPQCTEYYFDDCKLHSICFYFLLFSNSNIYDSFLMIPNNFQIACKHHGVELGRVGCYELQF